MSPNYIEFDLDGGDSRRKGMAIFLLLVGISCIVFGALTNTIPPVSFVMYGIGGIMIAGVVVGAIVKRSQDVY
jgi:hypothetical protein